MNQSLFERIGGSAAVDTAVEIFYKNVLADASISHFFNATDMTRQRAQQKAFLAYAFGGPNNYSGKDMRAAHAPLVEKGLNEAHFAAVAGHLQAVLEELGVAAEIIAEVMAIAGGTHDDVLGLPQAFAAE
jgi:hemoglobin